MKTERIEVHIEVLNDGRLRATSPDELIVADGEHIADLRRNVDEPSRRTSASDAPWP